MIIDIIKLYESMMKLDYYKNLNSEKKQAFEH